MRILTTLVALCLSLPVQAGEIMVMDPFARVARPGAPTGAAFLGLHNLGDAPDRLIGAESPVAEVVQIHTHIEEDGVMKMRRIEDGILLPAGAMHELARGGDHVMLMGLTRQLTEGERFSLTLIFEMAGEVTIEVPVDNARDQAGAHKH